MIMKKFKMLSLSLVATLSLGIPATFSTAQASVNVEPVISIVSDEIFVTRTVPYTNTSAIWVTETRNGKSYSGYIYNRGQDSTGNYSIFTGYLKTGPFVDPYILEGK